jgi:SOS response regulatory protein OraA/RecX
MEGVRQSDAPIHPSGLAKLTRMSGVEITPERVSTRIKDLRKQVEEKKQELESVTDELTWWESGLRFFGFDEDEAQEPEEKDEGTNSPEQGEFPIRSNGNAPPETLREGIFRIMRQKPRKTWQSQEVLDGLRANGWLSDAKTADHHARSKIAEMSRKGELRRIKRGHFRLPPALQ